MQGAVVKQSLGYKYKEALQPVKKKKTNHHGLGKVKMKRRK